MFACSPRELVTRLVLLAALCLAVHRISAQQSTFRSGVEVVQIDVSVVDRQGTPAGDLRPEDFQVTVDGRPRAIVSAQFIRFQTRTTPQPKLGPPPGPRPQPATAAPALPPRPRDILILIDQDGLDRRSCGSLAASRNPTRDRRCRSFALSAPLHARRCHSTRCTSNGRRWVRRERSRRPHSRRMTLWGDGESRTSHPRSTAR